MVSACLLGERVRYDGRILKPDDIILTRWINENRVIPICPEVAGGLPVPRPAAEILQAGAAAVLTGGAEVIDETGADVSGYFIDGARRALETIQSNGVDVAVLKDGSPSCGSTYVYDGTFSGVRISGCGVSVALLRQNDVTVFNERQFNLAAERLEDR